MRHWRKHNDAQNQIGYSRPLITMLGVLCVAPKAEAACTAATVEGSYGFRFDGFVGPSSPAALKVGASSPEAVVGEISFTATSSTGGTLTGSESGTFGGTVFQLTQYQAMN